MKVAENFLAYEADPINYKPTFQQASLGGDGGKKQSSSKAKAKKATTVTKTVEPRDKEEQVAGPYGEIVTKLPLRADYVWAAPVPPGLKSREVLRVASHLLTYCDDWEPGRPFWAQGSATNQSHLPEETT